MDIVRNEWEKIPGHDGYEATRDGRVRSVDKTIPHWQGGTAFRRGKVLKGIDHRGYLVVKLGHPNAAFGVHQLVAATFIGPRAEGMVVNHMNGDKHDNRVENLEYISNSGNVLHAHRTGLMRVRGAANGRAVLTEEMAAAIKGRPAHVPSTEIASEMNLKPYVVRKVRSGKTWAHVAPSTH